MTEKRIKIIDSKEKRKREIEDIVYYLCGRISKDKLLMSHQKWLEKYPNIMEIRNRLIKLMQAMNHYSSRGFLSTMLEVMQKIDDLLTGMNLFFPEDLEDFYIKIGLMNGIPMEYKRLRDSLKIQDVAGIQKHWKLFSNYIVMLKSQYEDTSMTEGEKAVLDRWVQEYNNLLDRYPNFLF